MTKGKLIGIGVGPGDTELLTIKASKVLKEVPIICAPRSAPEKPSIALNIVQDILDERNTEYKTLEPVFPMTENQESLEQGKISRHQSIKRGPVSEYLYQRK